MKIECPYCHHTITFNEKDYTPGESVIVECLRCGEEKEIIIPIKEDRSGDLVSAAPVVRKSNMVCTPLSDSASTNVIRNNVTKYTKTSKSSPIEPPPQKRENKSNEGLKRKKTQEIFKSLRGFIVREYFGIPENGSFVNPLLLPFDCNEDYQNMAIYCVEFTPNAAIGTFSFYHLGRNIDPIVQSDVISRGCEIKNPNKIKNSSKIEELPPFTCVKTIRLGEVSKSSSGWIITKKALVDLLRETPIIEYFSVPMDGRFDKNMKTKKADSLYRINSNPNYKIGTYTFRQAGQYAIEMANNSIDEFVKCGCIIRNESDYDSLRNIIKIETIFTGTVSRTSDGWEIIEKTVVDLIYSEDHNSRGDLNKNSIISSSQSQRSSRMAYMNLLVWILTAIGICAIAFLIYSSFTILR